MFTEKDLISSIKAVTSVVYICRKKHISFINGQDAAGVCLNVFDCLGKKAVWAAPSPDPQAWHLPLESPLQPQPLLRRLSLLKGEVFLSGVISVSSFFSHILYIYQIFVCVCMQYIFFFRFIPKYQYFSFFHGIVNDVFIN